MTLDNRIRELTAIGAAIAANCHSCLQHHTAKARTEGIPDDEIAEAIEAGRSVRRGAQGSMDKLANELLSTRRALSPLTKTCGCDSKDIESRLPK